MKHATGLSDATGLSRGGSRSPLRELDQLIRLSDATGLSRGVSRWPLPEIDQLIRFLMPRACPVEAHVRRYANLIN